MSDYRSYGTYLGPNVVIEEPFWVYYIDTWTLWEAAEQKVGG